MVDLQQQPLDCLVSVRGHMQYMTVIKNGMLRIVTSDTALSWRLLNYSRSIVLWY